MDGFVLGLSQGETVEFGVCGWVCFGIKSQGETVELGVCGWVCFGIKSR